MKPLTRSDLEKLGAEGAGTLFPDTIRVGVGMTACGMAAGAGDVYKALRDAASEQGLEIALVRTGCLGYCSREPLVDVQMPASRDRVLYSDMTPDRARGLVSALAQGLLPAEGALAVIPDDFHSRGAPAPDAPADTAPPDAPAPNASGRSGGDSKTSAQALCDRLSVPLLSDLPFYARQKRIVLRNSGLIDPMRIEEYIALGGYAGLARALLDLSPREVVDEVLRSGLRGRGGGGFPTGRKWRVCGDAPGETKYVVCNADEGDPGAYMDRTVLESDPHSVIEGMIIGAYAVGASEGFIYVRNEYAPAIERLSEAVKRAGELGLLGDDILGSGFGFSIAIVRGAGAFVCGEETALIASIEGGIGEPRPRPPFPAVSGLWGAPTLIGNVKTWASAAVVLARGAEAFAAVGKEGEAGTVVFSLVGQVARAGLVEVPTGLTLGELIEDIGGGAPDGAGRIKAVLTGGPSGGCIPAELFHLPVDFESIADAGSIIGSGGMVVMGEDACMIDVARYFTGFTLAESCGKCTPCREGLRFMHETLSRIAEGRGTMKDIELLEEVALWVKSASLCGLGRTAPNPALSALRYFREECEAHVKEKRCKAGVCGALIELSIHPGACNGCGLCARACPAGAVTGEKNAPHAIDRGLCNGCRLCHAVCPVGAVEIVAWR